MSFPKVMLTSEDKFERCKSSDALWKPCLVNGEQICHGLVEYGFKSPVETKMLLQIKCPARKAGIETFQIICVLKRLDLAKRCWWWFWIRWWGEWWEVWLWSVLIAPLAILYESPHNNFSMTLINHHFDFQIVTNFDIISKIGPLSAFIALISLIAGLVLLDPSPAYFLS